ncbi:hypothetical protein MJO29_012510 [Puccinia striiformis f. sp. tritici]|nr:hypothetical protein MJO29_012510 [Puccinia striiformis f. sp. tritici]KAI9631121.1 hypothetical protein KEM48_013257 [Puccinia striiformis f. sp. tritici PST-130]
MLDLSYWTVDHVLDPKSIITISPKKVVDELCQVRGIGSWTAEMFLMFCVKNPDILPHGDLVIQKVILKLYTTPAIDQTKLLPLKDYDGPGLKKTGDEVTFL